MKSESHEPDSHADQAAALIEPDPPSLATCLEDSFFETRRLRRDGWDGKKMAAFCGTLAETGIVTFACRAADMSAQSAYALRHRNPIFARAWEAALAMARHRLADELLARSLKGSHEALLRGGAIVAERQHYDNKLAISVLRRLDRRAELGATFRTPPASERREPAPAIKGHWHELMLALAQDRIDEADRLLTGPPVKVDSEVDNPCLAKLTASRWSMRRTPANGSGGPGAAMSGAPISRRRRASTAMRRASGARKFIRGR